MIKKHLRTCLSRATLYFIILTHVLTGCNSAAVRNSPANAELMKTGPQTAETIEAKSSDMPYMGPKLDVVVPVFNPGLSENAENYEEEDVWPELRRAEANHFAVKLKSALENTGSFGAVRVTPNSTTTGDLYVLGKILESNGETVELNITVVDISGKTWLDRRFKHQVQEGFYKNYRKQGSDPYEPVFIQAAAAIEDILKKKESQELSRLQDIAQIRFGASFNEPVFMEHLNTEGKYYQLVSMPSPDDPMLGRISSIRVREQLFIDSMQQNYESFSQNMNDSYSRWQQAAFEEKQLRDKANTESLLKAIGGALLIGLTIAGAAAVADSDSPNSGTNAASVAVAGGLASAWMLSGSFKSREEAKLHKDALDEIGESINMELAPRVVSFEEESVELTGNIEEQFAQWREFLKKIYEQEATPDEYI